MNQKALAKLLNTSTELNLPPEEKVVFSRGERPPQLPLKLSPRVRVSSTRDHVIRGQDGKLRLKYETVELKWKEMKELAEQFPEVRIRFWKKDGDEDDVARFTVVAGSYAQVVGHGTLAEAYRAMYAVGLHVVHPDRNGGTCTRGEKILFSNEPDDPVEFLKQYEINFNRVVQSMERWLTAKYILKYGPVYGLKRAEKEMKYWLKWPKANPENFYGHGVKRTRPDGEKEYFLSKVVKRYRKT